MKRTELELPLLIYDGGCRFCRLWINYWKRLTGDRLNYAPYQQVAQQFPEISPESFQQSVQLVLPGGEVLSGAHAVFRGLARAPGKGWPLWAYEHARGFDAISEWIYRFVASHRDSLYGPTRLLFGPRLRPPTHYSVCWLFLRTLGLVYLIAFVSFGTQMAGLVGPEGILPAGDFLDSVHDRYGLGSYWRVPTLLWLSSGNAGLMAVTIGGAVASAALIAGLFRRATLLTLYVCYLSIVSAGQVFMSYQWDVLLLEAGFLALFLEFSPVLGVWLYRALLFRFVFLSGAVKLLSGDQAWRSLTALNFHYETQPLPTSVAWYAHQFPDWVQKSSVVGVFAIELAIPFLIFTPRRPRLLAALAIAGLNVLLIVTGNYTFFNLLVIAMCIFLLDDAAIRPMLPRWMRRRSRRSYPQRSRSRLGSAALASVATLVVLVGILQIARTFSGNLPVVAREIVVWASPFHVANGYGLFAVMTVSRPEIDVQGSMDGENWTSYRFKHKPGDPQRGPGWVAPHQPRLDWQMWFAALGNYRQNPWFQNFVARLLQGSPQVLKLLDTNPFGNSPPKYVRALLYEYSFTDPQTRRVLGAWWERQPKGVYLPPASLKVN